MMADAASSVQDAPACQIETESRQAFKAGAVDGQSLGRVENVCAVAGGVMLPSAEQII